MSKDSIQTVCDYYIHDYDPLFGGYVGNKIAKDAKRLAEELVKLSEQALAVLQLDFGYSPDFPCRHGHHPLRHQFLWEEALEVHGGELPDVEDTRTAEQDYEGVTTPLHNELKELRDIVERLPKTTDGVSLIVSEHPTVHVFVKRKGVYRPNESKQWWPINVEKVEGTYAYGHVEGSHTDYFPLSECYFHKENIPNV